MLFIQDSGLDLKNSASPYSQHVLIKNECTANPKMRFFFPKKDCFFKLYKIRTKFSAINIHFEMNSSNLVQDLMEMVWSEYNDKPLHLRNYFR